MCVVCFYPLKKSKREMYEKLIALKIVIGKSLVNLENHGTVLDISVPLSTIKLPDIQALTSHSANSPSDSE